MSSSLEAIGYGSTAESVPGADVEREQTPAISSSGMSTVKRRTVLPGGELSFRHCLDCIVRKRSSITHSRLHEKGVGQMRAPEYSTVKDIIIVQKKKLRY